MTNETIITQKLLHELHDYEWKKLEAYPNDKSFLPELHQLSSQFNNESVITSIDFNKVASLIKKVQILDVTLRNFDEACYASLRIQIGKLMLLVRSSIKHHNNNISKVTDKRKNWDTVSSEIFGSLASRSERFKLMNVASIPNVEAYSFLGIARLKEIESEASRISSVDPIGDILIKGRFQLDMDKEVDLEEFKRLIILGMNCLKLEKVGVHYTQNEIDQLTSDKGALSDKDAKLLKRGVDRGSNLLEIATTKVISPSVAKAPSVNVSPSYNELEETCLKLTHMMEDIMNDSYVPDYSPEITARVLSVLNGMTVELREFWASRWKDF